MANWAVSERTPCPPSARGSGGDHNEPDGIRGIVVTKERHRRGGLSLSVCVDAPSGAKKTTRSGELNREPKTQCGLFGLRESGGKRKEREMRRRIDVSSRCHHIVFGHAGTMSTA